MVTDVLPGVHDTLDALTSSAETKPKAAKPQPDSTDCRFCSKTFEGGARWFLRGAHEKKEHNEQWLKAKATGKTPVKKAAKKAAAPRAKAAPVGRKRIPAADSISTTLGMAAQVVVKVDAPLGRALAFSAPATGEAVDQLVSGTVVDRLVIQKFATVADKWEKVGGIIAFPVMIAVIARNPNLYGPLESQLRSAVVDVINASIPTLEKQKAKERKAADSLVRLGEIDERYAQSTDPIGLILQDIFGPIVQKETDGEAE